MDGGERINREEGGMGTVIFIYYSSVMVDFLIYWNGVLIGLILTQKGNRRVAEPLGGGVLAPFVNDVVFCILVEVYTQIDIIEFVDLI